MDSFNDVLDAAKEYCREHTADATYQYYISGLKAVSFENSNCITLEVRNDFICKIVSDRYTGLLREAFKAVLGFDVDVKFTVPHAEEPEKEKKPLDEASLPSGRYDFTFENFIRGPSNQFAFAAAQAVAANPSGAYNPLFIYGPSGLGKTHLLNAIQIEIHKNHPDFNIVYVDCEKFTNEIISAVKTATTEQFRQKYREADVLLIDDIQFLAGKESTQEEFFHTFNTLHNAGKQIVIASDRPAKEIKSLEERLRTRFEWGLTADIQPPDFETRVAIVKRKAELLNLDLPDDVAEYIANHLKQNIRQLEGAVKKLNAYYMLEGIAPCIGVTTTAIKDTLNDTQPVPVTIEKIINEVARTYNVMPADIRGKKRSANVSAARQMSMYIIREITGMSMEAIGSEFQRDHSTVVYSINTMEKNIAKDRHLKEMVDDIMKNIRT
ncbi:chromosomal replication initiator protein DnaA [bacterium]|uniref:chromosomal replication initiator protein DnaA n=1 Tax=Gemmiger sp. TaxID=2049027 RepID=UPI002A91CA24|nr:chromosomal replication initiator protein DnaA [Gemmiger sp.]MCI5557307.1 chromosomal replication initiator protein DnaA [bacterium]MCI6082433.1 chromosomal replication initiator protein DnaA [bacterium]MCI6175483.1 chromosomal replication initiator protein DnaA [bacterium]MCI6248032.1 chromosomal replication initiator protein DnaA [bacterium]MCI6519867.1 chromosomal replication initiator protein DnaA [bacterium]